MKKVEYYRIISLRGWLALHSFVFPKCIFITYDLEGEELREFIGYMDCKDVKEIFQKTDIELKIY